mmetsp:Transcript_40807/g.29447  ORF Transcript_40807/g.29447 Transcript_40807/m.29447 type:complete len:220 (+) Transcript_40807:50-709(+)
MRTAFGMMLITLLSDNAMASSPLVGEQNNSNIITREGGFTAPLTQQEGFDLRGFKVNKKLSIDTKEKNFVRPNFDEYMKSSKLTDKVQKMIDSTKTAAINAKKRKGQKTLRADPQIALKNHYENMIYSGPVFMGSESEEIQVVYDTGSDWLTVESANCRSCFGDNFDQSASSSWTPHSEPIIEEFEYLSGAIEGITGSDKVCLSDGDNCADDFEFFLIQ